MSEKQVDPKQRQIKGAESQSNPERSERSMRFHDSPSVRDSLAARKYGQAPLRQPVGAA